jgi:hypothetical protein
VTSFAVWFESGSKREAIDRGPPQPKFLLCQSLPQTLQPSEFVIFVIQKEAIQNHRWTRIPRASGSNVDDAAALLSKQPHRLLRRQQRS